MIVFHYSGKSPVKSVSRLLILPDFFDRILASDDDLFRTDPFRAKLVFAREGIVVSPDFEEVAKEGVSCVNIIDEDNGFVSISTPPLVDLLGVEIETGELDLLVDASGLAGTGLAIDPDAGQVIVVLHVGHVVFGDSFAVPVVTQKNVWTDLGGVIKSLVGTSSRFPPLQRERARAYASRSPSPLSAGSIGSDPCSKKFRSFVQ